MIVLLTVANTWAVVFRHQHEKSLMKTLSHPSFGSSTGLHRSNSHLADDKKKEHGKHSGDDKEKAKLEMVKVDVDNNMVSGPLASSGLIYCLKVSHCVGGFSYLTSGMGW